MRGMEIEWEEPREEALLRHQGGSGRYINFALGLRKHPERWAKFPGPLASLKSAQLAGQNIRRGKTKGFEPAGHFEALADELEDGTIKLYVRYAPPLEVEDGTSEGQSAPQGTSVPPASPAPGRRPEPAPDRPEASRIREWARANGFTVPDRGRMPQAVYDAYNNAMDEHEEGRGEPETRSLASVPGNG